MHLRGIECRERKVTVSDFCYFSFYAMSVCARACAYTCIFELLIWTPVKDKGSSTLNFNSLPPIHWSLMKSIILLYIPTPLLPLFFTPWCTEDMHLLCWWLPWLFRFMENLQSEVIELEFHEFSHGMSTISEVSFATILLRYTNLHHSEIEECLERVRQRMPEEKVGTGIF